MIGPKYGNTPNAGKSVLIVKNEATLGKAKQLFASKGITVTSSGDRHLGAVIGSPDFKRDYVGEKVRGWVAELE